jgi:hypothetical protein
MIAAIPGAENSALQDVNYDKLITILYEKRKK